MTPTLLGRWQSRLLLFVFLGLPITALFSFLVAGWGWPEANILWYQPFNFITYVTIVGLILDPLYIQLQRFRWDQDWPFAFQFFFTIVEFLIVLGLVKWGLLEDYLPELLNVPQALPPWAAVTHFTMVFIPSFIALLAGVQLFLIRWRFKGGEISRFPISSR